MPAIFKNKNASNLKAWAWILNNLILLAFANRCWDDVALFKQKEDRSAQLLIIIYSKEIYYIVIGKICCVNYAISNMADRGARTLF